MAIKVICSGVCGKSGPVHQPGSNKGELVCWDCYPPDHDFVVCHRFPEGAETVKRLDCPTCGHTYIEGELHKS